MKTEEEHNMKPDHKDINDTLKEWQSRWEKIGNTTPPADTSRVVSNAARRRTEPMQLERTFTRLGIMGLLFPCLALCMREFIPQWMMIVYSAFGVTAGLVDLYLARRVRGIYYVDLPVLEAVSRITRLEQTVRILRYISMVGGLAIVAALLYCLYITGDKSLFYGGLAGLAIGLPLGLRIWIFTNRRFRRWRRAVVE